MGFVIAAVVFAFSPQTSSAANPHSRTTSCALSIDATTVSPGETHALSGSGFGSHQSVAVKATDGAAGRTMTDAGGVFRLTVHVPLAVTGDLWRVVAASRATSCSVVSRIAASSGAGTPEQPSQNGFINTGVSAIAAAILGAVVATGGLLFLTVGRRRRA